MKIKTITNSKRYEVVAKLNGRKNIGIELGVAEGNFSYKMMESKKFIKFYGIDSYNDFQHNENEYNLAKKKMSKFKNYELIKNTFKNSLNLFKDDYFDFIYIDGFAHTGNNGGETIFDWFHKLKIGGILSGDDYHKDWPLVIEVVNNFVKQTNLTLFLTDKPDNDPYSQYPSWFVFKEREIDLKLPTIYMKKASINHKIEVFNRKHNYKKLNYKLKIHDFLNNNLPKKLFKIAKMIYKKIF